MATYWVSTNGDDGTGDGSQGNPYATINKTYQVIAADGNPGHIINLVNDGNHTWPLSTVQVLTGLGGADYDSDPGLVIQGVDAAGSAAMATVQVAAGSAGRFLSLSTGTRYVDIKGIFFDMTLGDTGSGTTVVEYNGTTSGPTRLTACRIKGWDDNVAADYGDSIRTIWRSSIPEDWGEIRYCLIENLTRPINFVAGIAQQKFCIHHNVIRIKEKAYSIYADYWQFSTSNNANNVMQFYNNTVYWERDATTMLAAILYRPQASGDAGTVDVYNNIFWYNSANISPDALEYVFAGVTPTTTTWSGTVGYNVVALGPDVESGEIVDVYEEPWADGVSPKTTDVVVYETALTTLFNDPTSTYVWSDVGGSGYDITIPEDLRPQLYLTTGLSSTVPGALPPAESTYTVTISALPQYPYAEETSVFTVGISNSGTDAEDVEVTTLIPSGLTYVSHSTATGTYSDSTGVWSVGSLADAASASLTIITTVDSDQGGESITVTATLTDSDPGASGTSTTSASVTLEVVDEDDPDGLEDGAKKYLDVRPFYTEDLRVTLNARISCDKGRVRMQYLRKDYEEEYWREMEANRVELANGASTTLSMGGVERGRFMLMESTQPVKVTLNGQQWPAAKLIVLGDGDFQSIELENSSGSSATILTSVVK